MLTNPSRGHHSPIADQRNPVNPESLPKLLYLGNHGVRIGGVSREQFACDLAYLGGAQQAEDDRLFALLAVAAGTQSR